VAIGGLLMKDKTISQGDVEFSADSYKNLSDSEAPLHDEQISFKLTAAYEKDGDIWIGYLEEIPGVNSQGATISEVRKGLWKALSLMMETNRDATINEFEGPDTLREVLFKYEAEKPDKTLIE
jgi:predicted RNase H-like HicB family nuclease